MELVWKICYNAIVKGKILTSSVCVQHRYEVRILEIRPLRDKDDLSAISHIYEESWKYAYKEILPKEYLDSIPKGRWCTNLKKEGLYSLLLIEDNMFIGTLSYCKSRWDSAKEYGEIVAIYFLPEYIGKGYGKQLLRAGMKELSNMGYSHMLLWVLEENSKARHFYERNGFTASDEYMENTIGGRKVRELMYRYDMHV